MVPPAAQRPPTCCARWGVTPSLPLPSLVVEGADARQVLALQELEGGTAASGAVADLVLRAVLLARRGGVTTTNHGGHPSLRHLDDLVHHLLCALFEAGHLEDTHGAVPDNGLRLTYCLGVLLDGLRAAVKAHEALWDALRSAHSLHLAILTELGGDHEVHRQDDLHALGLGLVHDLWHDLRTLLIEEGATDARAVQDLDEGECHATTDDHDVDLVQQVLDQLDLVANLGTAKDGSQGTLGAVQHLAKGLQLLGNEEARALDGVVIAHHGAVRTVSGAERVTAEDVSQLADGSPERVGRLLVRLDLFPFGINTLALLFKVEAAVLKQDDGTLGWVGAGSLNLGTSAVAQELDRLAHLLLQALSHRRQGELLHPGAVGAAKVRAEDHRLAAFLQAVLDGGQCRVDALGVRDHARVLLVLRNVEIDTDEDALVSDINGIDPQLVERHAARGDRKSAANSNVLT
mmetsp:Transcript_59074/g.81308  ORF Transcript_59074/g.81308 Transcript_59074/m.81308 type:complete len:461 (-) Transcript_59074:14-1396(-)